MTPEQGRRVESKLAEIQAEIARHEEAMKRLRQELIVNAEYFETYDEMYRFIRAHTPTLEAFCIDMLEVRTRRLFKGF